MDLKSLMPFALGTGADRDPFALMRREMERMFEDVGRGMTVAPGFLSPKVDVAETEAGLEIHAELPGLEPKDIDLEVDKDVLTLKAETGSVREEKDEKRKYHLVERSKGTYLRRFQLPFAPDEAGIRASFDKGVLTVTVPRATPVERPTRKIEIGTAG